MNTQTNHSHFEQALPADVSVQSDTWLTRYRNFPVFSRIWFKHRTIAFGAATFMIIILMASAFLTSSRNINNLFIFTLLPFLIGLISLLLLGQSIAVWVKSQRYSPKKEAILVSLAIVFGAVGSYGITEASSSSLEFLFPIEAKNYEIEKQKKTKEKEVLEAKKKLEKEKEQTVKAKNNNGQNAEVISDKTKEEIAKVVIQILSFFPTIFLALYQASFFDLYLYFRQRKRIAESQRRQELKQAQEARREAELRLSVLVAQVEPHFLFNTLAGVRSAILTEPLRATVIVDHLVDYLRATIPNMREDGSSNQGRLAQQLESARAYLGLMQARIPRLSFDVTSEIKDAALPPLLLISLVENAIKHGVEPKIGPVHISVTAKILEKEDNEFLEITVCDNGVGFGGTTSGSGIGLTNIRERLESTYGKSANLTLKARAEGGVEAIITLPLSE